MLTHGRYRYDMSIEEAAELARRSIYHATFRDVASGGVASGTFSLSLSLSLSFSLIGYIHMLVDVFMV